MSNSIKSKFEKYERHVKPTIVQRNQPASLIFGSSYSEVGFDPKHAALTKAGESYNFALAGASWEIIYCDVQFAISHDMALHQIVLGIHPDAMPQQNCADEIAKMERPDEKAFLLSHDALESSINTVLEQHNGKPSHTIDGMYFYMRGAPDTARIFREYFTRYVSRKIVQPEAGSHRRMDVSGLRDIVDKAVARGITVKLVVYPRHALLVEHEYQLGMRQNRWDALAQIISVTEQQDTKGLVELWDFEGYHKVGAEIISTAPGIYWQDPAHFNYEFGNIMLDEMFALKPQEFGARLTNGNLRVREAIESDRRSIYLREHPEFLRQLESLLPAHAN